MTPPINTPIELILHPYAATASETLPHILIAEFLGGHWSDFRGAIHFIKQSGNYPEITSAIRKFLEGGGKVQLTFGADVFGRSQFASEYDAVQELLSTFSDFPGFVLHLYHEPGRTFHPKVYMFSNDLAKRALLILGSSNWSAGGFQGNVEVDVKIHLDLTDPQHTGLYETMVQCFDKYWSDPA